jgi:hypothetical protein
MTSAKDLMNVYIDEFCQLQPNLKRSDLFLDSVIIGTNGILDSLEIINFVIGLEEFIKRETGKDVKLFHDEYFTESLSVDVRLEDIYRDIDKLINIQPFPG